MNKRRLLPTVARLTLWQIVATQLHQQLIMSPRIYQLLCADVAVLSLDMYNDSSRLIDSNYDGERYWAQDGKTKAPHKLSQVHGAGVKALSANTWLSIALKQSTGSCDFWQIQIILP